DRLAQRIASLAKGISIGHPLDAGVFMGPLASEAALARFETGISLSHAETILASRRLSPRGLDGCYTSPSVHRVHRPEGSAYEREQLFGPDLAGHDAPHEYARIALAHPTAHALAALGPPESPEALERCRLRS